MESLFFEIAHERGLSVNVISAVFPVGQIRRYVPIGISALSFPLGNKLQLGNFRLRLKVSYLS